MDIFCCDTQYDTAQTTVSNINRITKIIRLDFWRLQFGHCQQTMAGRVGRGRVQVIVIVLRFYRYIVGYISLQIYTLLSCTLLLVLVSLKANIIGHWVPYSVLFWPYFFLCELFQTAELPSRQIAVVGHPVILFYYPRGVCRHPYWTDIRSVELPVCLSGRPNASAWAKYLVCFSFSSVMLC